MGKLLAASHRSQFCSPLLSNPGYKPSTATGPIQLYLYPNLLFLLLLVWLYQHDTTNRVLLARRNSTSKKVPYTLLLQLFVKLRHLSPLRVSNRCEISHLKLFSAFQCLFVMFRNFSSLVIFYDLLHQLNLRPDPTHLPKYSPS